MHKIILSALFILLITTVNFARANQTAIFAGGLVDVAQGKIRKDALIVIENDRIVKIGTPDEKDKYPQLIDLSQYTVLPGLIDCHAHLIDNSHDKSFDVWELPIAAYGIIGTVNAKRTLDAGFTTVRDVWGHFYSDVALRDAIEKELIPGPRMYVSGPAITMTGGHGAWGNWLSPQIELKQNPAAIADGPDEIRKQVRLHVKNKVDLIKLAATGGFGTSGSIPGAASYSEEEMRTAVEEAKKNGLKVAAHAHGADGIKNAVRAGVASIEHGTFLDDEAIDLMKKHDVFLVTDLLAAYYDLIETKKDYSDKKLLQTNEDLYKNYEAIFIKAYGRGVRMAFGTDAGIYPHGQNARQFALMKKAGMKPADIIKSATVSAAELIGIEKQAGTIEAGKWADLIAVKGNPLEDVSVLENVSFVMKGGRIYKQ